MNKKKKIRFFFKKQVFERDHYRCKLCDYQPNNVSELDAHHITDRDLMPNGGYVLENGITLCNVKKNCHLKAELFHITKGKEWEENSHPNDLYKKINSNYKLAFQKSKLL